MKYLVLKTETKTYGTYVEAADTVHAIHKVKAMEKPRWFLAARNDAEWSAEGVPEKRKAPR